MNLDAAIVALLAVIATAVAGILLVVVVIQALRLRALDKRYVRAFANGDHDVVAAMAAFATRLDRVETHGQALDSTDQKLAGTLTRAVSHASVVRYDAFSDMGGEQSFSLALLDANATGVVLTAINGRSDTRVYAKAVVNGTSESTLSPEEEQAIALSRSRHQAARPGVS